MTPAIRLVHPATRGAAVAVLSAAFAATPATAHAQDRLIGSGALGVGATAEAVRFGGSGFFQPGVAGRDSIRLRSIEQISTPFSVALPIGTAWTVDVSSVFSYARLTADPKAGTTGPERTTYLFGPSDVRIRATGRLFNDALVVTSGFNVPTGKTELDGNDLTVLQAVAAPALGLGTPPVGAGPSGTLGLIAARQIAGWAVAVGGSYEFRGTYQPIAALVAGSPSTDFTPGNVVRASLGLDRLIGKHRLSITGAADLYSDDILRDPLVPVTAAPIATVMLGPVYTTDVQLQLAAPRVKELVLWGSNRFRSRFERDGVEVAGTSGNYLDGGLRTSVPLTRTLDLLLTGDGRWHTGLAINQGLATSGVISGGGTLGLIKRAGTFSIQPYMRAQGGQLRPRVTGTTPTTSFFGGSAGLVIVTRF